MAEAVVALVVVATAVVGCEVTIGLGVVDVGLAAVVVVGAVVVVVAVDVEHPRTSIETKTHMVTKKMLDLLNAGLFMVPASLSKNYYENNPDNIPWYFRYWLISTFQSEKEISNLTYYMLLVNGINPIYTRLFGYRVHGVVATMPELL